jgi:tetratricopeptide (TPR) repeat protein
MLPVLLLLLDYWPLKRMKGASEILPHAQEDSDIIMPEKGEPREKWWVLRVPSIALVFEKFPLFLLAGAGAGIAYMSQSAGGAVRDMSDIGLGLRLQNAAVNYIEFLRKAVWPDNIAVFYPLPDSIPAWKWAAAALLLVGITWGLILWRKRAPWAIIGWAWFLVAMLPVIGVVQLSDQAMADRYSYMPYLGLFIAVAWFIPFTWAEQAKPRIALVATVIAVVMLLFARVTWNTLNEWSDTRTLFQAAADRTTDNHLAYAMLASQDIIEGNNDSAIRNMQRALAIKPDSPRINHAAGRVYLATGQHDLAISHLTKTLESNPNMVSCHLDLSRAFEARQQVDMAIYHLERASELRPESLHITRSLILLYIKHNALAPAEKAARAAMVHQPKTAELHFLLGSIVQYRGKPDEALEHFQDALLLDPENQRIKDRINELKGGAGSNTP